MIHFFVEDIAFDSSAIHDTIPWLEHVAEAHAHSIFFINYIFCSDQYLLKINREYLDHNYYTDIITFDHRDSSSLPIESDIFISIERVKDNSNDLSVSFHDELLRVMVHGLLHLLGYDDHSDTDQKKMRSSENSYLNIYHSRFQNTAS